MHVFQSGGVGVESGLIQLPVELPAVFEVFNALPQLVGDVAVLLVLVPGVLRNRGRNGGGRDYAQDVAGVDQLHQTLQELAPDSHVLGLELEVVGGGAGGLKQL